MNRGIICNEYQNLVKQEFILTYYSTIRCIGFTVYCIYYRELEDRESEL